MHISSLWICGGFENKLKNRSSKDNTTENDSKFKLQRQRKKLRVQFKILYQFSGEQKIKNGGF